MTGKNDGLWEDDFVAKNRKAMRGVSESEEEFQRRNKKAIDDLRKKNQKDRLLGGFLIMFLALGIYGIIADFFVVNALKYWSIILFALAMVAVFIVYWRKAE